MADLGSIGTARSAAGQKAYVSFSGFAGLIQGTQRRAVGIKAYQSGYSGLNYGYVRSNAGIRSGQVPNLFTTVAGTVRNFGGIRSGQVPTYWTLVRGADARSFGFKGYQAGYSGLNYGIIRNHAGVVGGSIPSYFTTTAGTGRLALGFSAYQAGYNGLNYGIAQPAVGVRSFAVPTYWTLVRASASNFTGVDAFPVYSGLANLIRGTERDALAVVGGSVPTFWTLVRGREHTESGVNAFPAGAVVVGPVRGRRTLLGTKVFPINAEIVGRYSAQWRGLGLLGGQGVSPSITMYLREYNGSAVNVRFDFGASNTLASVYCDNLLLTSQYIGELNGPHTIRGQIYDRTVYVKADDDLKMLYTIASNQLPLTYTEQFTSLASYTTLQGNPATYQIVTGMSGTYVRCIPQTVAVDVIRRTIPLQTVKYVGIRFRLATTTTNDAAVIRLRNSADNSVAFELNPRREVFWDAAQRPLAGSSAGVGFGTTVYLGTTALAANTEYICEVTTSNATGFTSTIVIRNALTGNVLSTYTHSGAFVDPLTFDTIELSTNTSGALTSETHYDYVEARGVATGRVGFMADNICLDTFTADFAGEPVLFREDFETGSLASYTSSGTGNPALYQLVGGQGYGNYTIYLPTQTGLYNVGRTRIIPTTFVSEVEWVFKLDTAGNDDAMSIAIGSFVSFNPSREPGLDFGATDTTVGQNLGRPRMYLAGGAQLALITYRLPSFVWYKMRLVLSTLPNGGTYTLTRESDGAVLASGALIGTIPPQNVTQISFGSDCSAGFTSTGGWYDNITLR